MLDLVARGAALGMNAGLSPGPLQTYLIQTALSFGWRRSLIVALSPLLTDAPIIIVILLFLSNFPPAFIRAIQIAGGLFLWYLAWNAFKDARSGSRIGAGSGAGSGASGAVGTLPSKRGLLLRAVQMNFLSPGPYIFWGTINGPLLLQGLSRSLWDGISFLLAFYGTFLTILCGLILLTDRLRSLSDRANRVILYGLALIMALFGGSLIWQGIAG